MYAFALAAKTMSGRMIGKKCIQGVELLTQNGTCPVCKNHVERSYTDIFFPYCGYTCKRIVQKKDEEDEKLKILTQQKIIDERRKFYRDKRKREIIKMTKELKIKQIQQRIIQCESEYDKNFKEAERLPKKSEKRRRAKERARNWYKKMINAQIELNRFQKGEEELNDSGRQADLHLS